MSTEWQHPWFDHSRAPLLVQRYPRDTGDQELIAFTGAVEAYMAAHPAPFAWVCDASNLVHATARQRQLMGEFEKRTAEHDRKYCLGTALVVASPVARGIITAVYWLSPPVYPYRTFARWDDAEKWARERLAEKGVRAP
jgi:hypothetical protein